MTQYHEIPFETQADASYIRIELPEGETPTPGALFNVLVFSPSPYTLYLSCLGTTKRTAVRHPVSGSGQASFVFSDSESVSGLPEELTAEQIGNPNTFTIMPTFNGDELKIPVEAPAALYDYETVSFADLVEIDITETVTEFLITGKNEEGETTSLSVTYTATTTPGTTWAPCESFTVELESPATIRPGDTIIFRTAGPVPVEVLPTGGGTVTKLTTTIEDHTERLTFVDGFSTTTTPIYDDRKDKRYGVTAALISGGVWIEVAGAGGEMPPASWNELFADLGTVNPPATWEAPSKKVFVQKFLDLGEDYGRGIVADVSYKTEWTKWTLQVPADWYATGFPVAFQFLSCDEKEHVFTIDIVAAAPPKNVFLTYTDRDTSEALESGAVSLGIDGGAYVYKGLTDINGQLTIVDVPAGTHKILFVKSGWVRTDADSLSQNDWITVE